jgi:hypothetical protein
MYAWFQLYLAQIRSHILKMASLGMNASDRLTDAFLRGERIVREGTPVSARRSWVVATPV